MRDKYYLKDKKLSLWDYATISSKKTYFSTARLIWTYYAHNGGSASISGTALKFYDENAAAIFVINRRTVKIGMLIVYNHKIYQITRIDDYEGYKGDIRIYAKLASNQSFTAYNGLEDDYVTTEDESGTT